MKYLYLVIPFISSLCFGGTTDTLDYWKVFYKRNGLKELNYKNESRKITLHSDSISAEDSLSINYFHDVPCRDCPTNLSVEDDRHHPVISGQGKGTGNPVTFSLSDLLDFKKRSGISYFEIYYYEEGKKGTEKTFICRIKLE